MAHGNRAANVPSGLAPRPGIRATLSAGFRLSLDCSL